MKAATLFSEEEKKKIKETTQGIELRTDGEIAVVVTDSSDRYLEAEILAGIIIGSLLALAISVIFFHESLYAYIPLSFVLFFLFKWIGSKFPRLKLVFIGHRRKEATVHHRALQAFYEKRLDQTKHHTGVLFFLSLFERKVWVLADKGIHSKMDDATLIRFAKTVSQGIKENRACEALCQAIEGMGQLLAEHFPITPDHADELPDEVMIE